jgi:serine/threonine-protein phosphatase 2A regulatory subunit B'
VGSLQVLHTLLAPPCPAVPEHSASLFLPAAAAIMSPLQELDEQLYEECRQRYEQEQRVRRQKEDQRQREWQQMQHRAQHQAQVKGLPNGVVNCSSNYTPILIRSKS